MNMRLHPKNLDALMKLKDDLKQHPTPVKNPYAQAIANEKARQRLERSNEVIKGNLAFHTIMDELYTIPLWPNKVVYDSMPPNDMTRPLTSWSLIKEAFGLTPRHLELLMKLYKLSADYGVLSTDDVDHVIEDENDVLSLLKTKVIQQVSHGKFTINPAIIYGRSYLSPFTKGLLCSYWVDCKEPLVTYDPLKKHRDRSSVDAGFRSANWRNVKVDIDCSDLGKKTHSHWIDANRDWERLDELEVDDGW